MECAGINILAVRIHDYDAVGNLVCGNTSSLRKMAGSLVYFSHISDSSIPQSPHTTMQSQKEWDKQMRSGPGVGRSSTQQAFEKTVKIIDNYLA